MKIRGKFPWFMNAQVKASYERVWPGLQRHVLCLQADAWTCGLIELKAGIAWFSQIISFQSSSPPMKSELPGFQPVFHNKPERAQPEILGPSSSVQMPALIGRVLEKMPIPKIPSSCDTWCLCFQIWGLSHEELSAWTKQKGREWQCREESTRPGVRGQGVNMGFSTSSLCGWWQVTSLSIYFLNCKLGTTSPILANSWRWYKPLRRSCLWKCSENWKAPQKGFPLQPYIYTSPALLPTMFPFMFYVPSSHANHLSVSL